MTEIETIGSFQILVDSDSCPTQIRAIIIRACRKHDIPAVFAADRPIPDVMVAIAEHTRDLRQKYMAAGHSADEAHDIRSTIRMHLVPTGENSADDYMVTECRAGNLCVTRDILLASRLIEKEAIAITDRGQVLNHSNIAQRLSEKNINSAFREAGMFSTEQNKPLSSTDVRNFANSFSSLLQKARPAN
ncbi:MAG: DUF188 domain-containing protein [Sphaerochaetaceae bacterium]|jgi:uncharacterized protein|nr:DUF188 domain-containing protein [Sphaerochaetaceae bacterium]NLY07493.1 hypothetical protein [Spirochaetales bacterium]